MSGHDSYLELVRDHEHGHIINPEFFLQVFGMACVAETFFNHCPLVDRGSDKDVDIPVLDVPDSTFERPDGTLCRFGCRLSRLNEGIVRKAIDYVDLARFGIPRALDHVSVHLVKVMDQFAVESENLGRAIDDRSEGFQDPCICQ